MFFGREGQIEQLESLWRKRVGSLVTCRGRRRIGKSTLIEQFAKRTGGRLIKIEGVKPKPKFSMPSFRLPACWDFEHEQEVR